MRAVVALAAAVAMAAAAFAATALTAALVLSGCARREPARRATVYPYRSDAAKVFYATSSGLSEMTFEGEAESELPASKAPNASILSADEACIAIAVNGWGFERVETSPATRPAYRIVDSPDRAAFAGLSTGGIWPRDGGFLVHLYRDPFDDPAEDRGRERPLQPPRRHRPRRRGSCSSARAGLPRRGPTPCQRSSKPASSLSRCCRPTGPGSPNSGRTLSIGST